MGQHKSKRWWLIVGTGIIFIVCLALTSRLHFDEKITSMLPDSDPAIKDFIFVLENVPALEVVNIHLEADPGSPGSVGKLEETADALYESLADSGYFSTILYKIPNDHFLNLVNLLNNKAPFLLTPADLSEIDDLLTPANINRRLATLKRQLIEPSGLFLRETIMHDPLNINGLILKKLAALKDETSGIQMKSGRIWSSDGNHLLMIASPVFPAVDTVQGKKMIAFLNSTRNSLLKNRSPGVHIRYSGVHIATLHNSSVIQKDVKKTIAVLSIAIVVVGFLFFSRKLFICLVFLPTTFSLTFSLAVLSLIDPYVSAIALGCGAVLIGITVDFGIHILYLVDNTASNDNTPAHVVRKLYKPLTIGAVTTITAFMSLMFSSLPGQRQMGLYASLGVMTAAIFAGCALVYFIPGKVGKHRFPVVPLLRFCTRLKQKKRQNRKAVIMLGIIILAVSCYGITKFKFEGDVSKLNHLSPELQADFHAFEHTWGNSFPTLALIKGDTLESALDINDNLNQILGTLKNEGMIKQVSSIAPILPSMHAQNRNNENWQKYWSADRRESMKVLLDRALAENGFSNNIFEPFYKRIEPKNDQKNYKTSGGITLNDFKNTALEKMLDAKIIAKDNQVLILTTFTATDAVTPGTKTIDSLSDRITNKIPGTIVLNKKHFVEHTTRHVRTEFGKLALIAGCGVFICLFVFFRNIKIVLGTILPILLSIFITLGTLGILGISINLISILFIVFVFGVGVDFSIFLMCSKLSGSDGTSDHEAITYGSVIICALTTTGAFVTLIFAEHAALFSIGAAGLIGMIACLVSSLVIVPAFTEKFIFAKKA